LAALRLGGSPSSPAEDDTPIVCYSIPIVSRSLLLLAVLALAPALACKSSSDITPDPAGSAKGAPAAPAGHVQLTEAAAEPDVETQVVAALAKSSAAKRRLVVYVGATWCEPCQHFHQAAAKGELDASFPDLDVLAFDTDRDHEKLAVAGYYSHYIPLFALPKADGTASGKQIEGGVKGDGAVAQLTPRLKGLLAM
jgi:thiol-disulfide isomerase/thioredoxin